MHPITHFLVGWNIANAAALDRRDRAIVTGAGVIADIDGVGVIADLISPPGPNGLPWFEVIHRALGHNLGFAILVTIFATALARRRFVTALLSFFVFHLHLLGDLMGSRGPDGYQWPIPYLAPFSDAWQLTWAGQWQLNAWPNILLTLGLLGITFYLAWRRGHSPLEIFSPSADQAFVETFRRRFGRPVST